MSPLLLGALVVLVLVACPLVVATCYFASLHEDGVRRLGESRKATQEQRARAVAAELEVAVLRRRTSAYEEQSFSDVRPVGGERACLPPAGPTPASEAA